MAKNFFLILISIVVFSFPFDTSKNCAIFFSDQIKTSGCSMTMNIQATKNQRTHIFSWY